MKQRKLYNVRFYPEGSTMSRNVGFKGRLMPYRKAVKVVARLRKSGVECVSVPMIINL